MMTKKPGQGGKTIGNERNLQLKKTRVQLHIIPGDTYPIDDPDFLHRLRTTQWYTINRVKKPHHDESTHIKQTHVNFEKVGNNLHVNAHVDHWSCVLPRTLDDVLKEVYIPKQSAKPKQQPVVSPPDSDDEEQKSASSEQSGSEEDLELTPSPPPKQQNNRTANVDASSVEELVSQFTSQLQNTKDTILDLPEMEQTPVPTPRKPQPQQQKPPLLRQKAVAVITPPRIPHPPIEKQIAVRTEDRLQEQIRKQEEIEKAISERAEKVYREREILADLAVRREEAQRREEQLKKLERKNKKNSKRLHREYSEEDDDRDTGDSDSGFGSLFSAQSMPMLALAAVGSVALTFLFQMPKQNSQNNGVFMGN